jgi:hypothetical protein
MTKKSKSALCWLSGIVLLIAALDAAYLVGYRNGTRDGYHEFMSRFVNLNMRIGDPSRQEETSTFPGANSIQAFRYSHSTN